MKGIILAGGSGTRLYPLTKAVNKHLLPVGKYPMIFYPIFKMRQCGITEILIITGKEHIGNFVNLLSTGRELGLVFTYRIQEQAGGIAQALSLAADFVGQERCLVILGDNIVSADLCPYVEKYQEQPLGAKIFLKKVPDPHRYGVAEIQGDLVVGIEEKPTEPKSDLCVTGIYLYDQNVFKIIQGLKPSHRDEMEITDVNNAYIQENQLTYDILDGWWIDAGTFESIRQANEFTLKYDLADEWKDLHWLIKENVND